MPSYFEIIYFNFMRFKIFQMEITFLLSLHGFIYLLICNSPVYNTAISDFIYELLNSSE